VNCYAVQAAEQHNSFFQGMQINLIKALALSFFTALLAE
jgi:hypothetical protein